MKFIVVRFVIENRLNWVRLNLPGDNLISNNNIKWHCRLIMLRFDIRSKQKSKFVQGNAIQGIYLAVQKT